MKIRRAHIALGIILFFILLILLGRFVFFVSP
jgi:hypothetical protein